MSVIMVDHFLITARAFQPLQYNTENSPFLLKHSIIANKALLLPIKMWQHNMFCVTQKPSSTSSFSFDQKWRRSCVRLTTTKKCIHLHHHLQNQEHHCYRRLLPTLVTMLYILLCATNETTTLGSREVFARSRERYISIGEHALGCTLYHNESRIILL